MSNYSESCAQEVCEQNETVRKKIEGSEVRSQLNSIGKVKQ